MLTRSPYRILNPMHYTGDKNKINYDKKNFLRKLSLVPQEQNEETFDKFVSNEDFASYLRRKRRPDVFGNHIEIAAMSELYNRVIEVFCYSAGECK